jgi:hypothetical protein
VGLGEEPLGVSGEERRFLGLIANAHRQDCRAGHAGLLGLHPFHPHPGEALLLPFVENAEGEMAFGLAGAGQRHRDPTDVLLGGHAVLDQKTGSRYRV